MTLDIGTTAWTVFAFFFGAIVGSFLNVCIWRLPRGKSLVQPPSHCPACEHQLHFWPDMVPLFSQLFSWSRCRYCGARFSWRYFWVEVVTGLAFAAVAYKFSDRPWELAPDLIFVSALIAIAFIDFESFVIPDVLVWVAGAAGVVKDVALMAQHQRPLWYPVPGTQAWLPIPASIWGAAICCWLLWQLAALASAAVKKEAMGGGDTFLLAAMGASMPFPQVATAFFLGVGIGAIGGICQLAMAEWHARRAPRSLPCPGGTLPAHVGEPGAVNCELGTEDQM